MMKLKTSKYNILILQLLGLNYLMTNCIGYFLICLTDFGCEKFKPLLEKYSFFKIVKHNPNQPFVFYRQFYKDSAFDKPKDIKNHLEQFV